MKRILTCLVSLFFLHGIIQAQELPPAPADKAVVYFARLSAIGSAINFSFFDSATIIGRFNGTGYIRYECAPGIHLFWARSENRDFVEAELEAGRIYIIEAVPQLGAIKAGVALDVLDPRNERSQKRLAKFIKMTGKQQAETLPAEKMEKIKSDLNDALERGLAKYQEEKSNGTKIQRLEKDMYYTPAPAEQ